MNGRTHYVLPAPNLLSFAVPVQRKYLPNRNGKTSLKKRKRTKILSSFVRSSSVPLTLSDPSTVNLVWTLCSLLSSSYAIRTRSPGIFHYPSYSFTPTNLVFSCAELLAVFIDQTACSRTLFTTHMHAHHPLIPRLSTSQRPLLPHYILLVQQLLSGKSSLQTHLSVGQYLPCQPIPRLLCSRFLVPPYGAPIRSEKRARQ
jgi:hypothetical protein